MVCIDWKDINKMKKNPVKDHSSYANSLMSKKNDVITLEKCMDNKLNNVNIEETDNFCCSTMVQSEVKEKVIKNPNNLVIYLERIV